MDKGGLLDTISDSLGKVSEKWENTSVLNFAMDYFWHSVTDPFYTAAEIMGDMEERLKAAVMAPINTIIDMFGGTTKAPQSTPQSQIFEGQPTPIQPQQEPEFNPFRFGSFTPGNTPVHIELASQPLSIQNQLVIDRRVLASVVSEIIQHNRDVHYHTYGSDPMGFATT